jgi:SOS response regulatory protein OraA/RecX
MKKLMVSNAILMLVYLVLYFSQDNIKSKENIGEEVIEYLDDEELLDNVKSKEDIEKEKRKGYKELKIYMYMYKLGKINKKNKKIVDHYTYDKEGNILIHKGFVYDVFYEYDEANRIHKITVYTYDGKKDEYQIYKYNKANMPIHITYYDNKGVNYRYEIMKYNKNKVMIEKTLQDYKGENSYRSIKKYNNRGDAILSTIYRGGKLTEESTITNEYIYDDKGQVLQKITKEDKTDHIDSYPISFLHLDTITYVYNDKGLVIEEQKSYNIFKYKYNERGLIIENIWYKKDGTPERMFVSEYK